MSAIVRLDGGGATFVLLLRDPGMPLIVYWGGSRASSLDSTALPALMLRASRMNGLDEAVDSAVLLPTGGLGFFGWPAISGHRHGKHFVQQFSGWNVRQSGNAATLTATDEGAGLELAIDMTLGEHGVLAMRNSLRNTGGKTFTLDRMMAATMLAGEQMQEILTFDGMWGAEFRPVREPASANLTARESRRGRTSHDRYPALLIGTPGFSENDGQVLGLHLGWSGNHVIAVDRLDDGRRLVHAGELFEPGEMLLAPGDTYESPIAAMAASTNGIASLREKFHAYVRGSVLNWPGGSMRPRPVTLNTWEGTYFDHNVARLKRQADAAAKLGIERFVLDDGWFGKRDDDTSSLGDWFVDPRKYPLGLGELVDHVASLGMEFGLWLEPEMVSPDSELYRAHPDWALQIAGRPLLLSRNQLVLDLTRSDVTDYLFERIHSILDAHRIAYIKWDMNRDLTAAAGADGRAATARQTRAVYALMERVRAAHPDLEIESCASGGGRADYGALARTHRIWVSDCTDALERHTIQRGASIFLPPEVIGAHVSASPNHQTHRRHSLAFRAITALAYHFGIELDPLTLTEDEGRELSIWITHHKRLRPLFHAGRPFRLEDHDGRAVHGFTAGDGSQMIAFVVQLAMAMREQPVPLRLPGLQPQTEYSIRIVNPSPPDFIRTTPDQVTIFDGGEVRGELIDAIGLPLPALRPETAVLLELTALGS